MSRACSPCARARRSSCSRPTATRESVDANRIFSVANPDLVPRLPVAMDEPFEPVPGLRVEMFAVPGKVPLWLEDATMKIGEATETTVGLDISAGGRRLLYIPGCAEVTQAVKARIAGADVLLFDGTLLDGQRDDRGRARRERARGAWATCRCRAKAARSNGLADADVSRRRIFVHINNTNPVLVSDTARTETRGSLRLGGRLRRDEDRAMNNVLTPDELEKQLRAIGASQYHNLHPFHKLLHGGKLNREQVQAWALNRFYYQAMIPIKDATILSRMEDPELRRIWRQRIVDHDGENAGDGGIERWLMLTDGLGFERDYVTSLQGLLPGTRFAVDAYVHFVREKPMLEAIASSLTELFSPNIISERVSGMLKNYDFISEKTLAYFGKRLTQAPARCRFRAGLREGARAHRQGAGRRLRRTALQVQRAVDAARRAAARLCRGRRDDPAGRLDSRGTRYRESGSALSPHRRGICRASCPERSEATQGRRVGPAGRPILHSWDPHPLPFAFGTQCGTCMGLRHDRRATSVPKLPRGRAPALRSGARGACAAGAGAGLQRRWQRGGGLQLVDGHALGRTTSPRCSPKSTGRTKPRSSHTI